MNSKLLYVIVAGIAVTLGFFAAQAWREHQLAAAPPTTPSTAPVLTLPEFFLKNRAGDLQSIRSWPQKSLIINFWATWCAPCRREIPLLKQLQTEFAAQGFQVVGIAVDFRDEVLKFADSLQIDYPLLIGEQDGLGAADSFGITAVGFPYTVFTDAKGEIITTHIGELHREQAVAVLNIVDRVNQGQLGVDRARTEVVATLSNLKVAVASEE